MTEQSKDEQGVNAYQVFRRLLEPLVRVISEEVSSFPYTLNHQRHAMTFRYEILKA